MAAINQPDGRALTVRDAAAACRLSPRTLRRKLTEGTFPNAYKTGPGDGEREGIWMIPAADLEQAGLAPTLVHPTLSKAKPAAAPKPAASRPAAKATPKPAAKPKPKASPAAAAASTSTEITPHAEPEADGPTVLELVRSDRFGRLRAELAEAVAAAEIALLRAEAERWRVLADERAQALDRADLAIKALTNAMGGDYQRQQHAPALPAAAQPAVAAPPPVAAPPVADAPPPRVQNADIVAVPPLVRAEAMRYTSSLRALHEARKTQNKWWQFWRV